jgi:Outer membrane protein beta-barrel domain
MKKLLLIFVILFPAAAQWRHFGEEPLRPTGFFGVGFSAPVNPIARNLDPGWNLAGGVGLVKKYVGVTFDATFSDFGINHSALQRVRAADGSQRYWALTVDPMVHVNPRGPVDFYITGGGGLYSQVTDYRFRGGFRDDFSFSNSIYKGGVNGGVGFQFRPDRRSHLNIFIEARYHHMFTGRSGASFVPITAGVRF